MNFVLRHFYKKLALNPVMRESSQINAIFAGQVSHKERLGKTHTYMEFMSRRSSFNVNFVIFFFEKV